MNNAMNVGTQISLDVVIMFDVQDPAFNSLGYSSRSEIAESYLNSTFNFLNNCHTVFYNTCTILYSHQQCTIASIPPHPHQHLFLFIFCNSHPNECEWFFIVVLICISLMIIDAEHLFMCLLAINISYLEKCLFKLFCPFMNQVDFVVVVEF